MTGNPSFPTPAPALAAVKTATDDLQKAETAAQARTKGAVAVRNEKRTALVTLLRQLLAYVRKPHAFGAAPGAVSGSAKLVAVSAGHAPRTSGITASTGVTPG